MNDISAPLTYRRGSGLLAEYGIAVKGKSEAILSIGEMLADKPLGAALVLIAEQGRHYGVLLFATPTFDEQLFRDDAERFGMDFYQAKHFVESLRPWMKRHDYD